MAKLLLCCPVSLTTFPLLLYLPASLVTVIPWLKFLYRQEAGGGRGVGWGTVVGRSFSISRLQAALMVSARSERAGMKSPLALHRPLPSVRGGHHPGWGKQAVGRLAPSPKASASMAEQDRNRGPGQRHPRDPFL